MQKPHDPIFKTVGQALYIVFAMEVNDATRKGATQVAIENMIEQRYGEVRDERERQINMGTMTGEDLRAQCGLTRKCVATQLKDQERDVIWARYGQRKITRFGEVQMDRRAIGCHGLADVLWTNCQSSSKDAAFALIFGIFASGAGRRRADYSLRKIEKELGSTKSVLHRDQVMLRKICEEIEIRATTRLEDIFMRTGLIVDPAYA